MNYGTSRPGLGGKIEKLPARIHCRVALRLEEKFCLEMA